MEFRQLGLSGLKVPVLTFGTGTFGGGNEFFKAWGSTDVAEASRLIDICLDAGVNMFDTAAIYSDGLSEQVLGKAIKGKRDRLLVSTKASFPTGDGPNDLGNSRFHLIRACEASLKRLNEDVIDLYYQHRVDPAVPVEETVGAMKRLVEQGKVRYLGLSEAAPDRIRRANAVHPIAAVQTEYSLLYRAEAEETREITRSLGIGFVAYAPLGRGFLTGQIRSMRQLGADDFRANNPRFATGNFEQNLRIVDAMEAVAREVGATPAQVALAWLLAQGEDIVPIPGTKRVSRLDENAAAVEVKLSADQVARLSAVQPPVGDRYADMSRIGR